ncbi:coiled-coil and C2 domain-containing 2A-like isoform X4 [Sigmodon hispidus]
MQGSECSGDTGRLFLVTMVVRHGAAKIHSPQLLLRESAWLPPRLQLVKQRKIEDWKFSPLPRAEVEIEQAFSTETEVLLDEGLSFFILSGEEDSAVSRSAQQNSVGDSYFKHPALGGSLQNVAEGQDEAFVEEVILMDLFEVEAAEYEDDEERIKKQEARIFVPSSSPGNIFPLRYSSHECAMLQGGNGCMLEQ